MFFDDLLSPREESRMLAKMFYIGAALIVFGILPAVSLGQTVQIRVTVENLAPANSVSLAPFRFGFGNGTFDSFNNNQPAFLLGAPSIAEAPIVTIAEGGSGSTWFPAFQSAEPNADL